MIRQTSALRNPLISTCGLFATVDDTARPGTCASLPVYACEHFPQNIALLVQSSTTIPAENIFQTSSARSCITMSRPLPTEIFCLGNDLRPIADRGDQLNLMRAGSYAKYSCARKTHNGSGLSRALLTDTIWASSQSFIRARHHLGSASVDRIPAFSVPETVPPVCDETNKV